MNETQIEKKAQRETERLKQYQEGKLAEELANGMALRNAALKQLIHKIKEEEILTVSAKAEGEEAATWAAKCSEQKQQYPSRTLRYYVSLALQAPQAVKMEKQEHREIRDRKVQQLSAMIREERAEKLSRAGMENNAARKRRAMAILKSALAKQ